MNRRRFIHSLAAVPFGAAMPAAAAPLARPIPATGEAIPAIGLGTWQAFDVGSNEPERERAKAALARLVAAGGALVDSSPMYGSAEAVTGALAAELGLHKQLFIATKVWTSGRAAGIRQMEDSIAKLKSALKGPLDLMQVHNLVDVDTHLSTLRDWKARGRIRYLGLTHYNAGAHAELERLLKRERPDFIQINYSIAEPQAGARLLPAAHAAGTAVIVNRPFAEGAMIARVRGKPLPESADELGAKSWAQLFLKWILADPAVTCVIPGTRNAAHVADNLEAAAGPLPDAAQRARIASEFARI